MRKVTILDFVANAAKMEAYRKWLNDPVTQEIVALLQTLSRPVGLSKAVGEEALYAYGLQVGYATLLDVMCDLEETSLRVKTELASQGIEADYGAPDIVAALKKLSAEVSGKVQMKETAQ